LLPKGDTLLIVEQPPSTVAVIAKTAPTRKIDMEILCEFMANP
jgi:hypothetical protein